MTGSRATRKRKSDAKDDQHVEDEVPISKESSKKRKQVENLNGAKRAKRGKLDSPSGEVDEELDLETSEGSQKSSKKRGSGGKGIDKENPFPNHLRPTEDESRAANDGLALLHGKPADPQSQDENGSSKPEKSILDSLVGTILSQNTTDTNSHRTFANLKETFKDWEAVRTAPSEKVEAAIKLGGLAVVKTERIKEILKSVKEEQGSCTLEHLRKLENEEIKAALLNFKGVGPKTAACVLMFSLGRFEFPVDTHVWRIAKNLDWVPKGATREQTYTHLNARIPNEIKYSLHVLMVEHGKRCKRCAKNGKPRKESHGPCPLVNLAHKASHSKTLDGEDIAHEAKEALSLQPDDIVKDEPETDKKEVKSEFGIKADPEVEGEDERVKESQGRSES